MVRTRAEALEVLGVDDDADAEQIRRAYRLLARRLHPDAGGEPGAFQRLQQALSVLEGEQPAPAASPSTSNYRRPSTSGPVPGVGESSQARWHEQPVDVDAVDWDAPEPARGMRWTRDGVAVAVAAALAESASPAVRGLSRKPGSALNRLAGHLSQDLFSSWQITPARQRGNAGHDLAIVLHFPPGRGRRIADAAGSPAGWVVERAPSATTATLVLHPSRAARETAVRAADALVVALGNLAWPIDHWHRA